MTHSKGNDILEGAHVAVNDAVVDLKAMSAALFDYCHIFTTMMKTKVIQKLKCLN